MNEEPPPGMGETDSAPATGDMAATGTGTAQPPPRGFFQLPGCSQDPPGQRRQGKVTVKYDRKELRKRLNLEEWIIQQLHHLYDCDEEEMPELEIDIDDLLDVSRDEDRALKLQESLVDCYKPTEVFVKELLDRIRGMRKLSAPQKK
eukprot:gi/632953784/ref/XP_007892612.1/ PREDICTED: protein phosphatase 1 regulatory subunit 14C [Callorhinchus milii]